MGANCCSAEVKFDGMSPAYRRALVAVIVINAVMFAVEMPSGFIGNSHALKADALDFAADTATYLISLLVIGKSLKVRATAALAKGISMGLMGIGVLVATAWSVFVTHEPVAPVMGSVGFAALIANVASVLLLVRFKDGDSNVRSVWLCSRNDAIGNLAVILAASGVWATGTGWPDLIVAGLMASLFLSGSVAVVRHAREDMATARAAKQPPHDGHDHEGHGHRHGSPAE
ncbi:cation transporter [Gimibacter soli]|uniref:Cation transporter n=1 Tax=Gimibacter soli TaxID=3024400 RepID=A0AAE9XRI8_9PROT|nr:cation transporter [Gimibacter soli]WCL54922.1 cation transporter [Gimibacter soli]